MRGLIWYNYWGQVSDPVPYGLEANRKTLECFIQYNVDQKVIPRTVDVEDIFDNSTLRLE